MAHIFMAIFGVRKVPNEVGMYTVQSGVGNPWKFPSNVSEYSKEWFLVKSPFVPEEFIRSRLVAFDAKPDYSHEKMKRLKERYMTTCPGESIHFSTVVTPAVLESRGFSLSHTFLGDPFFDMLGDLGNFDHVLVQPQEPLPDAVH